MLQTRRVGSLEPSSAFESFQTASPHNRDTIGLQCSVAGEPKSMFSVMNVSIVTLAIAKVIPEDTEYE